MHADSANQKNGNRFTEQYELWTIGVCVTVQIGERGTCTDVQIGERGKQRVKCSVCVCGGMIMTTCNVVITSNFF